MSKKFVVAVVLLLVVVSPKAVASPPEMVGSAMTFDAVADGLRKYNKETNWKQRCRLLKRLAETGDPRVGLLLGEEHLRENDPWSVVTRLLGEHFAGCPPTIGPGERFSRVDTWWSAHEPDLRRRAANLPR